MKIKKLGCIVLLAAALLGSCGPDGKPRQAAAGQSTVSLAALNQDTLAYEITYFKEFSPYFSGTADQIDSTIFSARYPVFNAEVNKLVKNALLINGEDSISQVAESFISGFNEYAEDEIQSGNKQIHCWFQKQEARVVLNTGRFLTLANALTEYTGGAHGMEAELWFNYDLLNSKHLVLSDIIADTTALKKLAEQYFRKHEKLKESDSFGAGYFFANDHFALADNFGLTRDGLLFHYNVYEIKAYSEGSTTIVVPYTELKGLLTAAGNQLVESLLKK